MKNVLLIATGGTIASKKTENGLTPQIEPEEMLEFIPDVNLICNVSCIKLLNLDSSNVGPGHWKEIVNCINKEYETYDAFVITHGTDTMAYTAAALSYMIQNSRKPIVLTGSQRPINLDITDAKTNLMDSFIYACDDRSQGVQLIFDGKVIAGTRAKKVRSKSYNAFSSIDFPVLAAIQDGRILRYIPMEPFEEEVMFYKDIDEKVFLLKLIPGMTSEVLRVVFDSYDAIIVESFGVGGIPASIRDDFFALYQLHTDKMIVIATQVEHEGSDMTVYEVGHSIKDKCNFLESYDMTPESVVAKTMWVLKNAGSDAESRKNAFYKRINYDSVWDTER